MSENIPLKMSPAELNTLAANQGVVTFQPHPKQLFAFDEYQNVYAKSKVFSDVYQKLSDNYFVSAKAILPGKTDLVKATVKLNDDKLKADSVQFITGKGSKLQTTKLQDGIYEITIVGGPANDAQELYAVYPLANGKYQTLGKLFIASYQPQTVKVALVPVNGTTLNKNEITEQLNKTYNPIGLSFTVREANNFVNTDWDLNKDNKLAVSGSGFLATQTAEMKALINAYKSANPSLSKDEAVLFMLNSSDSTANLAGDMPRGKQFGYLFSGADGNTAAHEIGHGVFKLEHTFKKYGFSASDLVGNMMNYPPGAGLTKFQWDAIHAPGIVIGVFEGDEDAMLAGGFGLSPDFKLISTNTNQILSDATPTADPFVGGFVSINKDNTEEYYYWREKDKPYQTNQGKDYVASKFAATDESVIWLLVNNSKDCKDRRYIRTLYKEVKTLIGNEDLAGLQKYVDKYLNQTDLSKPVYAGVLGCGKTGDGQGAGSNVLFVDYSTGKDGKSPFTAGQKNSLDKTITGIDNGLETALKVYLLNTGNPNYATQKAEAENDKAANKFIVTYNEQNQKLNLQYKLSIPKWLSDALPEATTDACIDKYVNDGLDELHNDPLYKVAPSFDQALQEINVVAYRGMFGILYCATNEESVQNASATAKFVAGGLHEIIATVDVKELVKGLVKMGGEAATATVKSYEEFYHDTKQTFQDVRSGKTIDNAVLIQRLLPPGLRTKVKLANTIVKVAKQFSSFYFTDCDTYKFSNGQTGDICAYRYGQITVMVVPIVFTAGEYAIAKGSALVARLKTISTLGRTEEVVNLLSKADDVGTIISESEKIIIKSGDEVQSVVKESGKAVIIDGVESIDDAIKVLERKIADPDLLKTAKEKAIAEAAEDASVLKDKAWLENIIKGNKFEAYMNPRIRTDLTNIGADLTNTTQVNQLYVMGPKGNMVIMDNGFVKQIYAIDGSLDYTKVIYNDSKLNAGTAWSKNQKMEIINFFRDNPDEYILMKVRSTNLNLDKAGAEMIRQGSEIRLYRKDVYKSISDASGTFGKIIKMEDVKFKE
ncbi:hypothetical protein [Pedobacter endophyticus]|uniref:Uncharacterized protein n=1 Tax=Pedobacter endophyticus TaxID=2789740 RepID=A0A7S9KZP5_9SPHI|nr:hypothetical protein [Pedobacter endophyticus]QPH39446.1 hypothetical protein IZT61_20780 [Pedobacter endophyticus]